MNTVYNYILNDDKLTIPAFSIEALNKFFDWMNRSKKGFYDFTNPVGSAEVVIQTIADIASFQVQNC
jgi:hypothetical protein